MMEMLDAIVTHLAVKGGLVWEGNPFIADVVGNVEFIFLKAAGVFLSGLILMILYKHFPRMSLVAAITIAAFYVFVLSWNSGMLLYIFLHI